MWVSTWRLATLRLPASPPFVAFMNKAAENANAISHGPEFLKQAYQIINQQSYITSA